MTEPEEQKLLKQLIQLTEIMHDLFDKNKFNTVRTIINKNFCFRIREARGHSEDAYTADDLTDIFSDIEYIGIIDEGRPLKYFFEKVDYSDELKRHSDLIKTERKQILKAIKAFRKIGINTDGILDQWPEEYHSRLTQDNNEINSSENIENIDITSLTNEEFEKYQELEKRRLEKEDNNIKSYLPYEIAGDILCKRWGTTRATIDEYSKERNISN